VKVGASVIKREQCAVDIGNREPPAFNVADTIPPLGTVPISGASC
jgi:hypothetical protein